jgi:very-short-patch-repair endonuclease
MPKFVEQICVICGTTFQAKKRNGNPLSQTCSMKCRVDKRLKTINVAPPTAKICKQCGKEFTVPKKYDKEHTMYCSNACRIANLPKGHVANPENTEIKHCLICGKPMKVIRCLRNRKKFCSDVCRQASPNKGKKPDPNLTVMRTCLECGKPIAVKRRLLNRKKFCSHSCSARHNVRKQATIRPTSIEVALYQALDLLGVPYIKQHSVKNYVFDAWLPDHKTIIEADGTYWHSLPDRQERDKKLAVYAKHMGYVLIRLDEMFIKSLDIQGLAEHIKQQLP